jgi:hypothetical protein
MPQKMNRDKHKGGGKGVMGRMIGGIAMTTADDTVP